VTEAVKILDASGKPARKAETDRCPTCGAGSKDRVASAGFGIAHPVCQKCGYEWLDEVWRG
jgi:transposase-like protein